MRWQTIDELACKKRELDMLREENHELLHLREASLESQRRDLTRSFETLISQREAAYTEKERLTAKRIEGLGDLFEQIKTENVRLKSELLEEKRRRDSFEAEALTRTEACRQIQWILDDERLQRQQEEDELRRRQQAASSEVTQLQAQAIELKTEFSTALNKVDSAESCYS
jgi:chromosome segregation ATPase